MSTNEEIFVIYSNSAKELFRRSKLHKHEFKNIYLESVKQLEVENKLHLGGSGRRVPWRLCLTLFLLATAVVYNVKPFYNCTVCALQEYIHPGLRLLRTISIPFVALFPSLTDLYDESCLVQNPLFRIGNMECWPCNSVKSVVHVNRPEVASRHHYQPPFVYKTIQQTISIEMVEELYRKNKDIFDRDASKVVVNNRMSITPDHMFQAVHMEKNKESANYYVWRINRIAPSQLIRKLIPRPDIVPKRGQSTEKFIIIDFSNRSFRLPDPECNFAFILQVKGDRLVELQPTKECVNHCNPISVLVKESHLLWYNWWYWRPLTQPLTGNETSLSHLGSYC